METLYLKLQEHIDNQDYQQVVNISESIISQDQTQNEARKCQIIAYLHLDQMKQAQSLMNQNLNLLNEDQNLAYAHAYLNYVQKQYQTCLSLLESYKKIYSKEIKFNILEAQTYFKNGQLDKSCEIFLQILENNKDYEEIQDLYVNALSICIQFSDQAVLNKVLSFQQYQSNTNSRELFFNLSLAYSLIKDTQSSKKYIQMFLQDLLSEQSDISKMTKIQFEDFVLYKIQQSYLDFDQIDLNQTIIDFQTFLQDERMKNLNIKQVIQNNTVCINFLGLNDQHYSESLKKINEILQNSDLNDNQNKQVLLNKLLILLSKNKSLDAQKVLAEMKNRYPQCINSEKMMKIEAFMMVNRKDISFKYFQNLINDQNVENLFCRAELARLQKNNLMVYENLIQILKIDQNKILNYNFADYLLNLIQANGYSSPQELSFIKQSKDQTLIQKYADFLVQTNQHSEAVQIYENIFLQNPKNMPVCQALINCLQKTGNLKRVGQILEAQSISEYIIDGQILQQKNLFRQLEKNLDFSKVTKQSNETIKKSKKIKKRIRLPKGFNPEQPGPLPDPERWLPKIMRQDQLQRKKYKGMLKKQTRNQGADIVQNKETTMQNFKNKASTANQDIAKNVNKNKKKKK